MKMWRFFAKMMFWPLICIDFQIHNVPFGGFGTVMCGGCGGYICPGVLCHLRVGYLHLGTVGRLVTRLVGRHLGGV